MTRPPEPWPAVAAPHDPVDFWLQRARCCGAPQLCGAICMDDERSQTEAQVVRRLDDAEHTLAAVREIAAGMRDTTLAGESSGDAYESTTRRLLTALGEDLHKEPTP